MLVFLGGGGGSQRSVGSGFWCWVVLFWFFFNIKSQNWFPFYIFFFS